MASEADLATLIALGPIAVFALALVERSVPIMPSYVLFIAIGATLVDGWAAFALIVLVSTLRSTLGAWPWFVVGRWLGATRCRLWIERYGRWLFLSTERYDALFLKFQSNAWPVIFVSQTIPTIRILVALPAGVIGAAATTYLTATFLGSLVWNGGLITAGVLVQRADLPTSGMIVAAIALILAFEALVWAGFKLRRRRQRETPHAPMAAASRADAAA